MTVSAPPPRTDRRARQAAERRARRALAIDLAMATALAAFALIVAAGLGVIAFFAVPILLLGLVWIGVEKLVSHTRRRGT